MSGHQVQNGMASKRSRSVIVLRRNHPRFRQDVGWEREHCAIDERLGERADKKRGCTRSSTVCSKELPFEYKRVCGGPGPARPANAAKDMKQ
eukprot:5065261-Pleurochrysis_carterae.AAC.2